MRNQGEALQGPAGSEVGCAATHTQKHNTQTPALPLTSPRLIRSLVTMGSNRAKASLAYCNRIWDSAAGLRQQEGND